MNKYIRVEERSTDGAACAVTLHSRRVTRSLKVITSGVQVADFYSVPKTEGDQRDQNNDTYLGSLMPMV